MDAMDGMTSFDSMTKESHCAIGGAWLTDGLVIVDEWMCLHQS
jgi:hypothetical protein